MLLNCANFVRNDSANDLKMWLVLRNGLLVTVAVKKLDDPNELVTLMQTVNLCPSVAEPEGKLEVKLASGSSAMCASQPINCCHRTA